MERKIRSKDGSICINDLINNEIKDLCETYEESKLVIQILFQGRAF